MQTQWWYPALATLGIAFSAGDAAAEGMRCGNRLVSKGDTTYVVRSRCGEPNDATRRVETRTERRRVRVPCGRGDVRCDRVQEVTIDVVIDEWVYDFGPQQFVRYVTFLDGRLYKVDTGSYGNSD
jgi:Protein of unknown function (DUF2845)